MAVEAGKKMTGNVDTENTPLLTGLIFLFDRSPISRDTINRAEAEIRTIERHRQARRDNYTHEESLALSLLHRVLAEAYEKMA